MKIELDYTSGKITIIENAFPPPFLPCPVVVAVFYTVEDFEASEYVKRASEDDLDRVALFGLDMWGNFL